MVIQEVLCAQLYNNAFLYHSVNNSQHQSVSFGHLLLEKINIVFLLQSVSEKLIQIEQTFRTM